MSVRTCPGCLTEYPPDKRFCAPCGIDLATGLEIRVAESFASSPEETLELVDAPPPPDEPAGPRLEFGEPGGEPTAADGARYHCPSCDITLTAGFTLCPDCGAKLELLRAAPPGNESEVRVRRRRREEADPKGLGWLWYMVKAFVPGLFRLKPLVLATLLMIPTALLTGMTLFFLAFMAIESLFFGAMALVCYAQAVVIIQAGQAILLPDALTDFHPPQWLFFFLAIGTPLVACFFLLSGLFKSAAG